jgi:hypothetical protein
METCIEDDEIGIRMDLGRKALFDRGEMKSGLISRLWKTVCSTSMNGIAAKCSSEIQPLHNKGGHAFVIGRKQVMQSLWMLVASLLFSVMSVRQAGVCAIFHL